ncbi:hypothetical protein OSB04_012965 [Centaurea solstitialis]|uniref:Sister chromatid cohesion 1 protein 3 n=1 Tax=Centaurea solstitialis TaxID=347529 RepID=A0AA38WQZ7_9ASTR|nr:hypothetical protein OSB04_012965 [Centaurea solstitialis]
MFYSHNLLARKGPLGTVWYAAHLQNKLKRDNYVTVNIPSTVEQIMNPQVPIALRMSGYLLLGVVRIYSKKVEYLQRDYNGLLIDISKTYTYAKINLPEDTNQANVDSITLPESFELDIFNVDAYDTYGSPDTHIGRQEDISIDDQSPISLSKNGDLTPAGFIMISVGEDVFGTPSVSQSNSQSSPMPIEASPHSVPPPETNVGVEEPDPNNQMDIPSLSSPDTEEPNLGLKKQLSLEKDNGSAAPGEVSVPNLPPVNKQTPPLDSAHSAPPNDNSDPPCWHFMSHRVLFGIRAGITFDCCSPSPLAEPAPAAEQPRENGERYNSMNLQSSKTRVCHNLSQMFEPGYKSTKPRVIEAEQDDMEVERIRDIVGPDDNNTIPTYSSGGMTGMPSPNNGLGSNSCEVQTSVGTGVGSTPDPTSSSAHVFSDLETHMQISKGQQGFDNSGGLPDIPEADDAGELTVLEDDEGMPTPPEIGSLLASTRAVAQFIKEKSSATRSTPECEGAVSLNSILDGKRRKVCARMFMETLILKSCELVDVKQDEAYGDITLKVTSKLLKQQFLRRSPDTHIRRHEDITLNDQTPISLSKNGDRTPAGYITISLGEDVFRTPSVSRYSSQPSPMPVEASPHSVPPPETNAGVQEPDPNIQMGSGDDGLIDDENVTRPVLRDAIHDNYVVMPSSMPSDREEPDLVLVEQFEKDNGSAAPGEVSVPDFSPVNKQTPPHDSAHSGPTNDNSDPPVSFGLASSLMAVQPSPLAEPEPAPAAEQPRAKRRKIQFDKFPVLTNKFIKKALDDPSNLSRKRKGVCSSLDVWRLNNTLKNEKVIIDPVITGLCHNLSQMFEPGYKSTKPRVIEAEQDDMEVERIRDIVGPDDNNAIPTYSPSGSKSYQVQTSSIGTVVGSTPDPTSASTYGFSDMETHMEYSQSHQGFENSGGLSDIPEVDDAGELTFLEDDEGTPTPMRSGAGGTPAADYSSGRQRTPPEFGSLLARTRAVAQFIKEKSSATVSTPEREGAVSLNSILDGKRRKVCARMFMETLILKSCELVDVKQDEAYGDITLKVTSKLLKQQF